MGLSWVQGKEQADGRANRLAHGLAKRLAYGHTNLRTCEFTRVNSIVKTKTDLKWRKSIGLESGFI